MQDEIIMSLNNSLLNINQYFDKNKIIELQNSKKCGLANIGATCYINSIIQLLGHCYPFLLMILAKSIENNNDKPLLFNELKEIFNLMWIQHHSLRPNKFLKALQINFNFIDINNQQDIHEILLLILNKINEELKINIKYEETKYNNNISKILGKKCDEEWFNYHKKEYSEMIELFYGQIMNQIKCSNIECKKIHHSFDYFSMLELEIPKNKENISLNDCINSYFSSFYLNSNEEKEWKCDKCNLYEKNKKVAKIWKMPPILFICIKRFEYNSTINNMIKNDIDIDIPEKLNFDKYIISPKTNSNYSYIGSALHLGRYNFGHYITLLKNNNEYIVIDDQNINPVKIEIGSNLIKKSYILLYLSSSIIN